ncbi:MAG: hypothetical protein K2W96_15330, partial [Gemmataceae bacterium]|nr:hypothetical protein [Gemmataceae bacterium]
KLRARQPLAGVLTADQKKVLEALKGKPAAEAVVRLAPPGPGPGWGPVGLPPALQCLADKAMADELGLAEDQKRKLEGLAGKWREKKYGRNAESKEQAEEARDLADALDKEARAALTEKQARRLAQIMLQAEKRGLPRERDLFTLPGVVAGLKLSDDQRKKLAAIVEERQKGLLALFLAEGEAKDRLDAVKKYNAGTYERLLAELSAEQRAALDGLFGKPFAGEVRLAPHLPRFFARSAGEEEPLHLFAAAGAFLGSKSLHKEIGADAEQGKKLAALAGRGWPAMPGFAVDEKKAAALRKDVEAILKPEQAKRLSEVLLRQYGTFPFGMNSLARLVEVRKGLGLTEEQLKKLVSGPTRLVRLESVLTDDQKAKWKEMLGEPTKVRLGPIGGLAGAGRVLPDELVLLQDEGVADDVKLSDEQRKKLAGIVGDYQKATRGSGGWARSTPEARKAATDAVEKMLDAEQRKRLDELKRQQARRAGLGGLLKGKEVAEGLKITDEQRQRLDKAEAAEQELARALGTEFPRVRVPEAPSEFAKARQALRTETERKMEAVLTKEQKEALAKLLGRPYEGELPLSMMMSRFGGGPPG